MIIIFIFSIGASYHLPNGGTIKAGSTSSFGYSGPPKKEEETPKE